MSARTPAAVGALFTSDADQLVSSGEWRRGRDGARQRHAGVVGATGGTRTIALETIRFPARDVAIADGRYEITGGAGGDRRMWSTFVMVRDGGTLADRRDPQHAAGTARAVIHVRLVRLRGVAHASSASSARLAS